MSPLPLRPRQRKSHDVPNQNLKMNFENDNKNATQYLTNHSQISKSNNHQMTQLLEQRVEELRYVEYRHFIECSSMVHRVIVWCVNKAWVEETGTLATMLGTLDIIFPGIPKGTSHHSCIEYKLCYCEAVCNQFYK